MFTPFQTHTGFPIENNRVNFHGGQISPIDSVLTGDNQELPMLSEILLFSFKFVLSKII